MTNNNKKVKQIIIRKSINLQFKNYKSLREREREIFIIKRLKGVRNERVWEMRGKRKREK